MIDVQGEGRTDVAGLVALHTLRWTDVAGVPRRTDLDAPGAITAADLIEEAGRMAAGGRASG